ncbi:hypothetical protein SALBM311S_01429 [Streptomyces alboniger]
MARARMPILYVEAVPVRVDDSGEVTSIGLLLRIGPDGTVSRTLVSGRVMHHERVRDALLRHLEKDLGPVALPRVPTSRQPFAVAEYFPTDGVTPTPRPAPARGVAGLRGPGRRRLPPPAGRPGPCLVQPATATARSSGARNPIQAPPSTVSTSRSANSSIDRVRSSRLQPVCLQPMRLQPVRGHRVRVQRIHFQPGHDHGSTTASTYRASSGPTHWKRVGPQTRIRRQSPVPRWWRSTSRVVTSSSPASTQMCCSRPGTGGRS